MSTPGINILQTAEEAYTVKVVANASEYFITIFAQNENGQQKLIDGKSFVKLIFESSYQTPFMTGQLQLNNTSQQTYLSPVANSKVHDYEMLGSGGEFLNIKIQIPNPSKINKRVTILEETYVLQNVEIGTANGINVLNYYFININYLSLTYTNTPWSTNTYINNSTHKTTEERQMVVSEAIKQLLIKTHGDENIIDKENWDESISKIEYTLNNNQPPIEGLYYLLSKYISKNNHDLGILTQNGGAYQLKSLHTLFQQSLNKNFGGAIIIETDNNTISYDNKQSTRFFRDRLGDRMIPVHISNITILPRQSNIEVDNMVDHNIASYNSNDKEFNLYTSQGTLKNLKDYLPGYMNTFPDADHRDVPVQDSTITRVNKHVTFDLESTKKKNNYIGKIRVQEKFIRTAEKIIFTIPGNLYIKGSNFVGLELEGQLLNQKMRDLQGMAFVIQNNTLITNNIFSSKLICSKLDKEKV
mgnify:CR=1 FL=1